MPCWLALRWLALGAGVAAVRQGAASDAAGPMLLKGPAGHTEVVVSVAFSGNGKRAITSSLDGTSKVWDLESGTVVWTLPGKHCAALSFDGRLAITTSLNDRTWLYDVESRTNLRRWEASDGDYNMGCAALSPDGTRAIVALRGDLAELWDVNARKTVGYWQHDSIHIPRVMFSGDGQRAIVQITTESYNGAAYVWDLKGGWGVKIARHFNHNRVRAVNLSPAGDLAITAAEQGGAGVSLWDIRRQVLVKQLDQDQPKTGMYFEFVAAAFAADGRFAITAERRGTVKVWNTRRWVVLKSFWTGSTLNDAVISPCGKFVLTANEVFVHQGKFKPEVRLWSLSGIA